jgi:hypothetical protein
MSGDKPTIVAVPNLSTPRKIGNAPELVHEPTHEPAQLPIVEIPNPQPPVEAVAPSNLAPPTTVEQAGEIFAAFGGLGELKRGPTHSQMVEAMRNARESGVPNRAVEAAAKLIYAKLGEEGGGEL